MNCRFSISNYTSTSKHPFVVCSSFNFDCSCICIGWSKSKSISLIASRCRSHSNCHVSMSLVVCVLQPFAIRSRIDSMIDLLLSCLISYFQSTLLYYTTRHMKKKKWPIRRARTCVCVVCICACHDTGTLNKWTITIWPLPTLQSHCKRTITFNKIDNPMTPNKCREWRQREWKLMV